MDNSTITSIIALIVAVGGVITAFAARRKNNAEAADVITEAAMKLLDPLNKRIDALELLTEQQEKELEILRPLPGIVTAMTKGIHVLISQIREAGLEPKWTPETMPVPEQKHPRRNGKG